MSPTIEIRKAGFTNKGAAMMLLAATQEVRRRLPGARLVVAANYTTPFELRAPLGLWHRAELIKRGVDVLGPLVERVPAKLRERYGFVTEAEVDIIFDAAGFAYSDQWGLAPAQDFAKRAEKWKRAGKKLILLPQAFGPFETPGIKEAMRRAADCADLIFAREQSSYDFLISAVGKRDTIRLAPDFTNVLHPVPTDRIVKGSGIVAIVPNARMLDKAGDKEQGAYLAFLVQVVRIVREAGLTPFFLVHETMEDGALARTLNQRVGRPLEIIEADDPLVAKGLIAQCDALIGSRFHALVSALSQSVPTVGTGWSHKYQELFRDYSYSEGLVRVDIDDAQILAVLEPLLSAAGRQAISQRLVVAAAQLKEDVSGMWDQVFRVIRA